MHAFVADKGKVRIVMTLPDGQRQTLDMPARQACRLGQRAE